MTEIIKSVTAMRFSALVEKSGDLRRIKGVATSSRIDRDGEILLSQGAAFNVPIPLLWQHDHSKPIGKVTAAKATSAGIEIEAQLAPAGVEPYIDEAWNLIKAGLVAGLSIGAVVKKASNVNGTRVVSEFEVIELSAVTVPANIDAAITETKSQTKINETIPMHQVLPHTTSQLRAAMTQYWPKDAVRKFTKAAVPVTSQSNTPALAYPGQAPGVVALTPITPSIITQLATWGAPQLPPNTRVVTQAALLTAVEVAEGDTIPAAAPALDFALTATRKFALIVAVSNEMSALSAYGTPVEKYVEGQLQAAANNATDGFLINLLTTEGTAAASVAAAFSAFQGDLRSAAWIAHPATLAGLQDAANPNVGPAGGVYRTLPALPCLAAAQGTVFLLDRARIAVFDGPMDVARAESASIVMDSGPDSDGLTETSMFQKSLIGLRITKYADAKLLSKPQVISL